MRVPAWVCGQRVLMLSLEETRGEQTGRALSREAGHVGRSESEG